jgi:hypothetical protein
MPSGSVEKLGNTFIITAKIVNIENLKVMFVSSRETKNANQIIDIISNIARKTANIIE